MFAAPYRRQRGNALLIPEEVVGVNRRLHLNQSIEVVLEVHGAENLGLFVTFGAIVGGADVHISFVGDSAEEDFGFCGFVVEIGPLENGLDPEADGGDSHGFVLLNLFSGDWVDDAGRRDGLEKKADEEIAVHGGYRFLNPPLGVDDTRVHRVVHGQPVLPEHVPVPSPAKVPADAHGGADPAGEPVDRALLRYPVVKLAERSPGLYPRRLGGDIHVDGPDIEHIKNNKARLLGDIRKPLIVMAAAADFDLNVGALGAQNHRRNVGLLQGSYNDDRFRRFRDTWSFGIWLPGPVRHSTNLSEIEPPVAAEETEQSA
nr:uncharacterized protein LOC111201667 [Ipomoea trifida]